MPLTTPGQVLLDKYRIERLLGSGGWGNVYLARDLELDRLVAIKQLDLLSVNAADQERFLREAPILAKLRHRHIVTIYSLEKSGGYLYIVMEYADQGSLLDRIADFRGGLPTTEVVDVGIAMCKALAAAHAKGIIHRDVKPHNILLVTEESESKPVPKLADFGIARDITRTPSTPKGQAVGTPAYMPPEAIRGSEGKADERWDVYGLGAVLYEALTKRPPLGYEREEIIKNLNHPPTAPHHFRRDVPEWLEQVVLKALAPNRRQRYYFMHEMLADLEQQRATRRFLTTSRRWRIIEQAIANVLGSLVWRIIVIIAPAVVAGLLISLRIWWSTLLGTVTITPTATVTESLIISPTLTVTITPTLTPSQTPKLKVTSTRAPTLTPSPTWTSPPPPTATPTPLPTLPTPTSPPPPPPPPANTPTPIPTKPPPPTNTPSS